MAGNQRPDHANSEDGGGGGDAAPCLPGRPANRLDPAAYEPAVYAWLKHFQELTNRVFTTRAAAAKALNVHSTTLSRRLNGNDLPDREFVIRFLDACERAGHPPSAQVRRHTTDLHLAALGASDKATDRAAHQAYMQADALQAANLRQADLEAQVRVLQDAHAHQLKDLVRERDAAVYDRVQAEHRLTDTQKYARAISEELRDAREQLRQLRLQVVALTEELLATQLQLGALHAEQQRRCDDEAVVAEALAVTEQALSLETARPTLVAAAATTPTGSGQAVPSPGISDRAPFSRGMSNLIHELEAMTGLVGLWRARRRLRAVAREWTPEEINGLVEHMNLMDWYSRDARRVMRHTRVRVHPALEPPGPLFRAWAKLRRVRLQPAMFTFYHPPKSTTSAQDRDSSSWIGIM